MTDTFKLYRLQQLDSQLDRMRARLKEIEAALSQDEVVRRAQEKFDEADRALQDERKALRRAEEEVQNQRLKIEQSESTLYSGKVRNPKELQDLQKELAALKRYLNVLEDRQLETMIAVEEAEAQQQSEASALEAVRGEFAQQHSHLSEEQNALLRDVARMEVERGVAAAGIPAEDMRLYDQLRQQRRGVAVARVTDRACSACGSTLNSALLHAARSPSQLSRCDMCGRILYGG